MDHSIKIDKPEKIKLSKIDPGDTDGVDEQAARAKVTDLNQEISELQELLYAASINSVLVVLQGMDTSGKDGTISHVFESINPSGVNVASFKVPTPLELSHDFLWRIHAAAPQLGHMTIFNRSHYEDVLVARVHKLVPEKVWKGRYAQINAFESILADSKTIILKFFLHIDSDEQKKRLMAREVDASKAWKLSAADWKERQLWDDYQAAYEEALSKTGKPEAPWYIIPANHKWYRNLAIAEVLASTLRDYRHAWDDRLAEVARQAKAEIESLHVSSNGAVPAFDAKGTDSSKNGNEHAKSGGKHKHGK